MYSTFNKTPNNALLENMFLGQNVNVSRYDQQRHSKFEQLIERQLSFFWRPEEIDISKDRADWQSLSDAERHIFISNLKYQTLLDSMAARSVNMLWLPIVSLPELETWCETHAFVETIHSRSYTKILRNLFVDPSEVFNDIVINEAILKRAASISEYFDEAIMLTQVYQTMGEGTFTLKNGRTVTINQRRIKEANFLAVCALNALESIRFYVSFACSFAFSERKLLEGNGKIIKLIARDEALHMNGTQTILNLWASGKDDPEMQEISEQLKDKGRQIFIDVVEQEKEWASYLFKDGSMIGLNKEILSQYIEYISHQRMREIGLDSPYKVKNNPLPWINNYIVSDNVQVAPQETEISSYLVAQVNAEVSSNDFENFNDI